MFDKILEMKQKMEEAKVKLDSVTFEAEAGNGDVVVTINGNRKVINVSINQRLMEEDKEQLEDLLAVAVNRAIELSDKESEKALREAAGGFLPNMPGLF